MATISSYTTASGKRYRVRYRTPEHRQTDKRGFKTKREAEAFAASVEVAKMRGELRHAIARQGNCRGAGTGVAGSPARAS